MNIPQQGEEPTFDESVAAVMQTLPPVIRDYLVQGKYTAVAVSLTAKYKLRIDQAGVLEREIMLLLMGIEDPAEFTMALAEEAQLDKDTVDKISQEINERIFIPLRKEEEQKGFGAAAPSAAPRAAAPAPAAPNPVAPPAPQRPAPVNPFAPHVAPLPPKSVLPARKIGINKLLEDHEEPHIEFHAAPAPATSGQINYPSRIVPQAPARVVPPPPANLPGAMPANAPPPPQEPPRPAPLNTPAPIMSYQTDPYRESINESVDER